MSELTDVNKSLTSPLLKTKVLANRLLNHELLVWVDNELIGYKSLEKLPNYRRTTGEICADYQHGSWKYTNQPIVFPKFDDEINKNLYSIDITLSIQALENFGCDKDKYLLEIFNLEEKRGLSNYLENQNFNLKIYNIYRRTPSNFVLEILSNVRSKLLDFLLQLEHSFGYVSEIKDLKSYNNEITQIMNTTITNTGDGNILNTGNNAKITGEISITKGNKSELKEELIKNQIPVENINNLLKIVDEEKPRSKDLFGEKVTIWIGQMINKAVDGTWQVSIGAAGGILATALQQYYGIK